MKKSRVLFSLISISMLSGVAHAGPYILAGTDADDHGTASLAGNSNGWLFMQKSLENLASGPALTNNNRVVMSFGSNVGSEAGRAAKSAFDLSSLASSGWSFQQISNVASLIDFAGTISAASILMFDSGENNVGGGLTGAEQSALTANAAAINSFVGAGGGLFSQANNYGWLTALVPTLTFSSIGGDELALTSAGLAAFPGLTNSDLSSGPYHGNFKNLGGIPSLATGIGSDSGLQVIIGAAGGSFTAPVPVGAIPEPSTYALMGIGLAAIGLGLRRKKQAA